MPSVAKLEPWKRRHQAISAPCGHRLTESGSSYPVAETKETAAVLTATAERFLLGWQDTLVGDNGLPTRPRVTAPNIVGRRPPLLLEPGTRKSNEAADRRPPLSLSHCSCRSLSCSKQRKLLRKPQPQGRLRLQFHFRFSEITRQLWVSLCSPESHPPQRELKAAPRLPAPHPTRQTRVTECSRQAPPSGSTQWLSGGCRGF